MNFKDCSKHFFHILVRTFHFLEQNLGIAEHITLKITVPQQSEVKGLPLLFIVLFLLIPFLRSIYIISFRWSFKICYCRNIRRKEGEEIYNALFLSALEKFSSLPPTAKRKFRWRIFLHCFLLQLKAKTLTLKLFKPI